MMTDTERDSYVRWQAYRIEHLSFSINLFLGFAVGSIAYVVTSYNYADVNGNEVNQEIVKALFWWYISAVGGVLSTISRLVDFRYTAKRIRAGRKGYQCLTILAGHGTWVFYGVALFSYCIGAWYFILGKL